MKPSQLKALERLYRRRVSPAETVTLDLARHLIELSQDIRRQIGVLFNRVGEPAYVIVGNERGLMIPQLDDYPLGKRMLRGLRLIHTHLKNEPLTDDDLTDLAMLRLDMVAVLMAADPPMIQRAWLVAATSAGSPPYHIDPPCRVTAIQPGFDLFIAERDAELAKAAPPAAEIRGGERGILISVTHSSREEAEDSLDELQELARTSGVQVLETTIQRPRQLNPRYLMGEGKMRDVVIRALQLGATMLVFDQELTPAQVRSISAMTELKVIDRSQLILDIFARRATSLDGKVQVELAQLKYLLPRLTGRGVQMSRLMGGIGGRGPGETKLEIDRRRIRDRIAKLEKNLDDLSAGRYQRRQKRVRAGVPIVSIVGYTNAGKSTLLNTMTKSEVFTEDLLFATLDTSTRRLRFPREREVIITDTVGFIRSLPASLMGAFKATLEELQDADLLLHLVDCASHRFVEQVDQVDRILEELGLGDKPRLVVFNKSDLLAGLKKKDPITFMKVKQQARRLGAITISAREQGTLAPLLAELERRFWA
ncbi:GTPase HflX [Geobacter sp. OR-1]|uniref:GTPase HflX n=1 Tax=Geobacter sp. OR-1 TaxID=1266765 RepID=UPI0005A60D62|nr:GTPase HflX [Geobacter sp. OR-1]